MDKAKLAEIIRKHGMWLRCEGGGEHADLRGADLSCADLSCADLRGANLRGADLSCADLSCADLRDANLRGVKYNEATAFFAMACP